MTYLPLTKDKSNFKLQLNTKVIRVIRDGAKMTGVEVENSRGKREIINLKPGGSVALAAGVLSTPRLLWHSGIGRKEQINIVKTGRTRIQVPEERDWINLPVGEGVQDHSRYMLTFNVASGVKSMTNYQLYNPSETDKDLYRAGSGVLTQSFMRMDIFRRVKTSDGHDIYFQAHVGPTMLDTPNQIDFTMLMTHGLTSKGTMSITPYGNTVFSKQPWLQTDTDKEAWTLALDDIFNMTRQPGSKLVYSGGKDAKAESVLRTPVQQGVHFAGGAKMGEDDGRKGGSAVVDLNNKVYGTDNLYIVDASFHPDLPTGNSQAIIMIAAEHAVQKIIAQGGK
jgi:cellobiose dehydrogenase (acceptor)